jgi:hypothetical protein
MSSGSEPSLNDDKVGVLTSEGISPSSDENVSAVMYTDSGENDLGDIDSGTDNHDTGLGETIEGGKLDAVEYGRNSGVLLFP